MISTPAAKISAAVFGVMPEPPAAFSPFAITKLIARVSRIFGSNSLTTRRPGWPTISAMNRIFTALQYWRGLRGQASNSALRPDAFRFEHSDADSVQLWHYIAGER